MQPRVTTLKTNRKEWTPQQLLEQWRLHLQGKDRSAGTIKKYTQAVTHFCAWYEQEEHALLTLSALTPIALIGYRNELQHEQHKSISTINLRISALRAWSGFQPNAEENVSRLQGRSVVDSSKAKPIGGGEQFSWKRPICIGRVYKSPRPWSKDFPGMKPPRAPGSRSANPQPSGFVSGCGKRASQRCVKADMDTPPNYEAKCGSF